MKFLGDAWFGSTRRVLWTGFGALTLLLFASSLFFLLRLQQISRQVQEENQVTRPRSVAARQIEINVHEFYAAVREHLDGNADARARAQAEAAAVQNHLDQYKALAKTATQRDNGARFAALWLRVWALGQGILTPSRADPRQVEELTALRLQADRLLDSEMQADAIAAYETQRELTSGEITGTHVGALLLLAAGMAVAILTSFLVGRRVLGTEAALADLNASLERKVDERTAELRRLSDELDARVAARTQDLVQSQARLQRATTQLSTAEETERERLAATLHDDLAQLLVLARMDANRAQKLTQEPALLAVLNQVCAAVDNAVEIVRSIMAQLSPRVLSDLGLREALRWLGSQYQSRHGLKIKLTGMDQLPDLNGERAGCAFQSVRELLWNVVKHAAATEVTISAKRHDGELALEVADNGRGFDLGNMPLARSPTEKFGLSAIRERIELYDGRFTLESAPGRGTKATLLFRDFAERPPPAQGTVAGGDF